MKQENNHDNFDKKIFDYYEKNKDISPNVQNHIEQVIKNTSFNKKISYTQSKSIRLIQKVAIFIISISIITVSTVFAKDIKSFINKMFTNSNTAIDKAVQNNYVEDLNMDFITSNDIGIKVDYFTMDSYNLDISFVYKCYNNKYNDIKSIQFKDLKIMDDRNNILFYNSDIPYNGSANVINSSAEFNNVEKIDDNTFRTSLLVSYDKQNKLNSIIIDISSVILNCGKKDVEIKGKWKIDIKPDTKFTEHEIKKYLCKTDSKLVKSINTSLTPTNLSIELKLNTKFDDKVLFEHNSIQLKDSSGHRYNDNNMEAGITSNSSSFMIINYPLTIYDNIPELYLDIKLTKNDKINLTLSKLDN